MYESIRGAMRRSTTSILTTHAGSLPHLREPPPASEPELREAVHRVVARQRGLGPDLVNEGEYTKGGDWLSFADGRFDGFELRDAAGEVPLIPQGADRAQFADFYRYASEKGTLFYSPGEQITTRRVKWTCTGPISYRGHEAVAREIALLRASDPGEDAFLTSTAPASLEVSRDDAHYGDEEEYLYALADALREEYELITEAGLVLQVDDAWLPALWDRIGIAMGIEAFRERCAASAWPRSTTRCATCRRTRSDTTCAGEAGTVPTRLTWSCRSDVVEHPQLVCQRIVRYAEAVGPGNVIAGTDCGFGGRSHPQIAWAKLGALVEGARLATAALGLAG